MNPKSRVRERGINSVRAVLMYYVHGFTTKRIARELGLNLRYVRWLILRHKKEVGEPLRRKHVD